MLRRARRESDSAVREVVVAEVVKDLDCDYQFNIDSSAVMSCVLLFLFASATVCAWSQFVSGVTELLGMLGVCG